MADIAVSVVITIWNSEKYLRECLDSVFNQSFDLPIEVIASANGSRDSSLDILKEYQQTHPNLVILNKYPNLGVAVARYDGIMAAKGKYIAFLDSDDFYHPDFLKVMYEEISKGYDVVGSSFFSRFPDKIKKNGLTSTKSFNSVKLEEALLTDFSVRAFMWNKMYKRELFTDHKMIFPKKPRTLFEDVVTLYTVFQYVNKYKSIRAPLYYYRIDNTSSTGSVNKERFNHHLYAFALIRHIADLNPDKRYVKGFRKKYWRCWTSLFFDAYISRKAFNHSAFKHLSLFKRELKLLKSKKPLPVTGEVWEQYFEDSLS